jgi:hypothetical protein
MREKSDETPFARSMATRRDSFSHGRELSHSLVFSSQVKASSALRDQVS